METNNNFDTINQNKAVKSVIGKVVNGTKHKINLFLRFFNLSRSEERDVLSEFNENQELPENLDNIIHEKEFGNSSENDKPMPMSPFIIENPETTKEKRRKLRESALKNLEFTENYKAISMDELRKIHEKEFGNSSENDKPLPMSQFSKVDPKITKENREKSIEEANISLDIYYKHILTGEGVMSMEELRQKNKIEFPEMENND